MTFEQSVLPAAYLGDGVYVHFDGMHLVLQVPGKAHSSGLDQRICLDPIVLVELFRYRDLVRDAIRTQKHQKETMQ